MKIALSSVRSPLDLAEVDLLGGTRESAQESDPDT